ncbi:MAG: hypothetical protein J5715_04065 [Clostridiales bacterium]|nr:hypothetical protein [Clostridiales bacterium]
MGIRDEIREYIRSGESEAMDLGLEIEHFIVDDAGVQIGFHEISDLILKIGNDLGAKIVYMDGYPVGYVTDEYSTSLEPACQFEISINPYPDTATIRQVYDKFYTLWEKIFEERGYKFVTKGNLPLVETGKITPDEITLSPKKRYKYMDRYFQESGKYGRYMMRASGSAQVSIDYKDEKDMVTKLRVLEKIAPILSIIMENKTCKISTLPEHPDKKHLLRIQEWDDLDPARTGFVPGSFDDDFGYDKMADVIYTTPLILLTDEGKTTYVASKTAKDLIKDGTVREDLLEADRKKNLIEHFMSMGFFHFRVKKYIEVRVADAVPIDKALGYVALLKGLVYSEENLRALDKVLANITSIDEIQRAVEDIEKDGLEAVIYEGKTAGEWAGFLIDTAANVLPEEDKRYLDNVRIAGSVV